MSALVEISYFKQRVPPIIGEMAFYSNEVRWLADDYGAQMLAMIEEHIKRKSKNITKG